MPKNAIVICEGSLMGYVLSKSSAILKPWRYYVFQSTFCCGLASQALHYITLHSRVSQVLKYLGNYSAVSPILRTANVGRFGWLSTSSRSFIFGSIYDSNVNLNVPQCIPNENLEFKSWWIRTASNGSTWSYFIVFLGL